MHTQFFRARGVDPTSERISAHVCRSAPRFIYSNHIFFELAGSKFKLASPYGDELPTRGFDAGENTYQAPPADGSNVSVKVDPSSQRLQVCVLPRATCMRGNE